ncbi:MAG: DUF998 domain-containing protein [Promethearchaeota archaeon]
MMGFYESLIKWKSHIYDDFLINPKVVKYSIISSMITFCSALVIGFIVAQFDPDGYNIIDNYISDMGSFNHTPLPYFLDYGAMITSILLIPAIFYMEYRLAPNPIESGEFSRMRYRLSSLGSFCMFTGFFGFFMVGLFSEDRTTSLGLHFIFSHVVFGGVVFSSIFYGLLILFYKTEIPRLLGLYMIIFPFLTAALMLMYYTPLFEWIMLFALLIWVVPVFGIFLKNLN